MAGDFVDHIYEAAVVPETWPTVLHDMMRMTGAMGALLITTRGEKMRWVTSSPAFEQLARDHYELYRGSERTRRLLACPHRGFITDLDVYAPEEIETEPLFQDFLIPRGGGSGVATAIQSPSGDAFIIHAERAYAQGPASRDILDRLDRARPHFARAALLSARLEMQRAEAAAQALELLGLPGAVLRDGGRVLAGNALFAALVPDLVQDRRERLTLADAAADRLFADALGQLGRMFDDSAIRSIPIRGDAERPPYILHVVPVRGAARDVFSTAVAVVVFTAVQIGETLPADLVQGPLRSDAGGGPSRSSGRDRAAARRRSARAPYHDGDGAHDAEARLCQGWGLPPERACGAPGAPGDPVGQSGIVAKAPIWEV